MTMWYFYLVLSLLTSLAEGNKDEENSVLFIFLRVMFLLAENTFESVGYPDHYPSNYIEVIYNISVIYPYLTSYKYKLLRNGTCMWLMEIK